MRQTSLKRTKRGYVRNLGRIATSTMVDLKTGTSGVGTVPKFYLGHDKEEANRRFKLIAALWNQVEELTPEGLTPYWGSEHLEAARAIARGEQARLPYVPTDESRDSFDYVLQVARISEATGERFQPLHEDAYRVGMEEVGHFAVAQKALGRNTGQKLHQALDAYRDYIDREYLDPDGTISDNGKTKQIQIKAIKSYLTDVDLAALGYEGTDELFGVFRRRPASKRYGTPMAKKSCTNYIGELGRFFKWLHLSKDWNWRKPEDFDQIRRTPRELDDDSEKEAADIPVWTIAQLTILNRYATPIERIFLLLGLNCAYGADQSGRLRVGHLHLDGTIKYIRRVRRKKKTRSIHLLWEQTVDGLRWALERRRGQKVDGDVLLLTEKDQPYWRKTKGGNRANAIPRLWADLLKRVRVDHPDFPTLPFNTLRDTSANMVRQMAGEELALLHLAHKHQSQDENLGRYTNPIRKKHFKVLRRLERKLVPVFEAAGPDPWVRKSKAYMGQAKVEKVIELRRQGIPPKDIAAKLDISVASVHRLAPASVKSKP